MIATMFKEVFGILLSSMLANFSCSKKRTHYVSSFKKRTNADESGQNKEVGMFKLLKTKIRLKNFWFNLKLILLIDLYYRNQFRV